MRYRPKWTQGRADHGGTIMKRMAWPAFMLAATATVILTVSADAETRHGLAARTRPTMATRSAWHGSHVGRRYRGGRNWSVPGVYYGTPTTCDQDYTCDDTGPAGSPSAHPVTASQPPRSLDYVDPPPPPPPPQTHPLGYGVVVNGKVFPGLPAGPTGQP